MKPTDTEILNFLQEMGVDTIYFDDGRILDVQSGDVRKAIANYRDNEAERVGVRTFESAMEAS